MREWTLQLTIPNHEDGGVFPADIIVEEDDEGRKDWECEARLYVPNHKLSQMESENEKLRNLVWVVYEYYANVTISPCDICDSTGCQYVGEAESGCRHHDRFDAAAAANEEILRRMSELGIDTKELI